MINLEDIIKQYQAGKLGTFSDEEAPNLKDHYDLKVQFNKSKHGIGYFPIFRDHIEAIKTGQQCSLADAYRICISEYLQMEMAFEERFVVQLEKHVVEVIYNGVDTIFVIYDDIKLSGAKRVWQEAHQLWARQTGNVATDPSLKKLEVPQFTLRMEALKDFANSLRWKWRKDNEEAWKDGARCRTRVLEAIDRFDYIVQMKRPEDDDFKKVDWPADRELPRIEWKRKNYTQYSEIAMFPQSLSDIIRKDVKDNPPQGRRIPPTYTGSKQLNRWEDISVISLKPHHQYVPGLIDPGSDKTISQGAGLTDWIQMQQTGKDPEPTREIPKPSELNNGQPRARSLSQSQTLHRASSLGAIPRTKGAVIGPTDLREPDMTDLEKRKKEEDEEYAKMLKQLDEQTERRKEELRRREEEENRKIAEMEDRIRKAAERRERLNNMTPEERLEALEEATSEREEREKKEREQQAHWQEVAKLGKSFYPQTLIPKDTVPEAPPGTDDQPGNKAPAAESNIEESDQHANEGMETDSDVISTEEQLEEEMKRMQEENARKERERWEEDERLRLEAEAKAKKDAEDRAKLEADSDVVVESEKEIEPEKPKQNQGGILSFLSKMTSMVTSTQIDPPTTDISDLGAVGGQPAERSKDETILAGSKTPSTKKQVAKGQPSITSFLSKQSSTLTDSHFQDSETESEASEFMTPTGSPNSTMRLRVSPEASPNRTLQATSLNETQPLENPQDPNVTTPLNQAQIQASIAGITPNSVSETTIREFNTKYHELVNITPSGMEGRSGRRYVTVRSRIDKGVSKLPKLSLKTKEDRKRSEGLKKRYPTPPGEKKKKELTFGKAGLTASKKRANSDEDNADAKKDRVKSPEKPEELGAAAGDADDTKQEDITAKSDDLSSLSILPVSEQAEAQSEVQTEATGGEDKKGEEAGATEEGEEVNTTDESSEASNETSNETVIANVKQEAKEDDGAAGGGAADSATEELDDTVILPGEDDGPPPPSRPRVKIIRDYTPTHQSPDKVPTPPPDMSGHIRGVQGMEAGGLINSEISQGSTLTPTRGVKKNFKALVDASSNVEPPSTAEKKNSGAEID